MHTHRWLSKLWSHFWIPILLRHLVFGLEFRVQALDGFSLGFSGSRGPYKEGTTGNTLPQRRRTLTKEGTYLIAILGTSVLNSYRMHIYTCIHVHACRV